jgi:hypothetical protein
MTPEEYAAQQAFISAATANYVLQLGQFFARTALSLAEWLNVLSLLFPEIQRQRDSSAALARVFYDSQRKIEHPELPRNDQLLESYSYESFVKNMDPVRQDMSRAESPDHALAALALRAVRDVENAGRRQIIKAVEDDPETKIIRGWARVATGRETCAWCLMLISRGPVYLGVGRAGLDLDETSALASYRDKTDLQTYFEEIEPLMEEWHDGCDCKVVPVFKRETWFGEQAAKQALELWNEATLEAISLEDDGLTHKSGKRKGKQLTRNELAINALRRRMSRGEIDPSEFAALAA